MLTAELLSEFLQQPLPTPDEKLDRLVLWVGDNQEAEHEEAREVTLTLAAHIGLASTDRVDQRSFNWFLDQVTSEALFEATDQQEYRTFRLTRGGWRRYYELKRTRTESRRGFMAMKFGDPELDTIFQTALKPGALRAGFELRKLTDYQPAGQIDVQLKAALLGARFIVADLTHGNNGAYWEAGFGEGRGIPVIYACENGAWAKAKTHFDTNHMVTVIWNTAEPQKAADELTALLRNTFREDANFGD